LKSNISTKFHRLLFCFYFTHPNLSKNYEIFCSVLLEGLEILPTFLENSKVLLKKILICKIIFFQNSAVYFFFFYFFIIFDILFSFSCICTSQKIIEIFMCFCFMDERFYQRILGNHGIFV